MSKDIRNLRIRFVIVVTLIVSAVIACIFNTFVQLTKVSFVDSETQFAKNVASNPARYGTLRAGAESISLPYMVVEVLEGEGTVSARAYFGIDDDLITNGELDVNVINELITSVHDSDSETGLISKYSLRYYRVKLLDNVYNYSFVNISSHENAIDAIRLRLLVLSLVTVAVFAAISAVLSRWVVKPVERAWEQQKQFVSDASHELKTPLTVITTNAELLQSEGITREEESKYINNIVTVSRQMRSLVEDLLNLARLEKADKSSFVRLNLSDSYQESLLQFEPVLFELGHMLNEDIKPDIFVNGNSQRLNQLLTILLDNAAKYSRPGDISVSLSQSGKYAVLCVANPAEEISQQQLKDIFKRFYRTDESHNEKGSYGLGLSIAQSICESHGGKIAADYINGNIVFKAQIPAVS